jgi:predicted helicase
MAKALADKDNVALCSMDDEKLYGKELYVITFSEAVQQDLLVDYKVLVLAVDEAHINARLQRMLADENNQLKVDDAAKIIGCWKALSKQGTEEDLGDDQYPMQRAVAFCQVIEPQKDARTHKVSSKNIASIFEDVVKSYQEQEEDKDAIANKLICEAEHIDGGMNASQKEEKLDWLKAELPENTCRILSNVRCLSEGVDVPALDAVLFLTPRNSQVDVVQSVGRVMRKSEGKKRGYVVLPVVIPADKEAHEALNDNQTYKVVWQVLQALRSHDDRFDAMVNKLDLIGKDISKMEVIAITDKVPRKPSTAGKPKNPAKGKNKIGGVSPPPNKGGELQFHIGEIERAIYAKVVQKCGNRNHWEDWAIDVAKIAKTHILRIKAILDNLDNQKEIKAFNKFANELRDDLNNDVSDDEVIEMLAQHLITKPVFDALFRDYSFASKNPMSLAMQDVLDVLQEHNIDKEADTLQRFYDSVKMRADGIDNASGRQKIILELYDKFFRKAFPKMTERLGIVYTPVEVVDFIIHSVNDVLKEEFGQTLGSEKVHIIDPFTGTGTFITRLLQSGLISKDQLTHKYKNEIHANELVLLAYYIAAINIESVYHDLMSEDGNVEYEPFEGICLTDTFQLHEKDDLVSELLVDNSARRVKQKALDIRVIIGNPPYSAGQNSANDNNKNIKYVLLDKRVEETYSNKSLRGTGKKSLYDSYIKAIRWASDRVKEKGIVCYVTNGSFIDSNTMDGLRACLTDEFTRIYCFNLRGNIRKFDKEEGQNIFGSASMTPVAITVLIKNPEHKGKCELFYHDIGEFLDQKEKLKIISEFGSVNKIQWEKLSPNDSHDWINKRNEEFEKFISIGNKDSKLIEKAVFDIYSLGVVTARDNWVYNFSKKYLIDNIKKTISFYNKERERFFEEKNKNTNLKLEGFIKYDLTQITWDIRKFQGGIKNNKAIEFDLDYLRVANYRPFCKQNLYFHKDLIHSRYSQPKIFPIDSLENRVICISCLGSSKGLSAMMINGIADIHFIGDTQCFPLYTYETIDIEERTLFDSPVETSYQKKENINDAIWNEFQKNYNAKNISKEDIFYYIYGLLHSTEYTKRFASDLKKMLPRIPYVKNVSDFWSFSKSGRELAELHVNYENVVPYPVSLIKDAAVKTMLDDADFRVNQMKFANKTDKSIVIYNNKITISGIPLEAYEYIVNGKPALEWVMERQSISTHKDSEINNDANDWAIETMNNPRYPLELFQKVVTVSLETMKIVKALPKFDI